MINTLDLSHKSSPLRKHIPVFYGSFELNSDPTEISLD